MIAGRNCPATVLALSQNSLPGPGSSASCLPDEIRGPQSWSKYIRSLPGFRRTWTEGAAFVTARCQCGMLLVIPTVPDCPTPLDHGTLPDAAAAQARLPADHLLDQNGLWCFDQGYKPSSSASQVSLSGNGLMVSMAWKSRPRIASPSLAYSPSEVSRSRSTEIAGPSLSVIRTIQ